MECSSENPPLVRRGPRTFAAVTILLLLAWITAACLFMKVAHEFSGHRIQGGRRIAYVYLPGQWALPTRDLQLEVLEDGQEMGPRAPGRQDLLGSSGGGYALRSRGWPRTSVLYLSPADGSDPRQNGRRYVVRYPRRQLPASMALLLGSWIILPLFGFRYSRRSAGSSQRDWASLDTAAWSVVVIGSLYTLFAVQARLHASPAAWFLAIGAVGIVPFLVRIEKGRVRLPGWLPWLAGLLAWVVCSAWAGTFYASPAAGGEFLALSVGGLVVYLGARNGFEGCERRLSTAFLGLFVLTAASSLIRDAGFDLAGGFAALGFSHVESLRLVDPWTTKFLGHWLLVVTWSTVTALGRDRRSFGRSILLVGSLAVATIFVNGSTSALVALLVSAGAATLAVWWPKAVRRLVVYGLVGCVLLAPLLAGVPWRVQTEFSGGLSEVALWAVDLDRRSGRWEFSRRFISLNPLVGWGFGASARLPGRDIPVGEALGVDLEGGESPRWTYPVFAGGHPHNAALLTWFDLGLVGALLVAGLLTAIGRSIAAVERHRRVHAALLGLLTATATYLMFNYPVWVPEVASILWMTGLLAAAALPRIEMARRQLVRDGVAALLVVAVGCALLAQDRGSRWWTIRGFRASEVVLDIGAGRLSARGEAWDLQYDEEFHAAAELVEQDPDSSSVIRGGAFGPPGVEPAETVLVFVGSDLVGVVWPERPSPALFAAVEPKDVRALAAGFEVPVEEGRLDLDAPVTIVALRDGQALAAELPALSEAP